MTPLEGVEWVGVAFAGLLALALVIEVLKPTRHLVRADVVDEHGELVATVTHVVGERPADVRVAGLRVSVSTAKK